MDDGKKELDVYNENDDDVVDDVDADNVGDDEDHDKK